MSIRETMNKNPVIAGVAVAIVVALAVYVGIGQTSTGAKLPTEAYYTSDDGKTFFGGPINQLPPFTQAGKEAVKAFVFECDGKKFVGYMSKLRPEAKEAIEGYRTDLAKKPTEPPATLMPAQNAQANGWLFKKPGDATWTPAGAGFRIPVSCGGGKPATAVN
jgi:hypothetical protein